MRKISQFLLAVALTVGLVAAAGATPASATTRSVTIHKIATKTAPYHRSVKVLPKVTSKGQVRIDSKRLTVRKGKATVVNDKPSANLKAGTYDQDHCEIPLLLGEEGQTGVTQRPGPRRSPRP